MEKKRFYTQTRILRVEKKKSPLKLIGSNHNNHRSRHSFPPKEFDESTSPARDPTRHHLMPNQPVQPIDKIEKNRQEDICSQQYMDISSIVEVCLILKSMRTNAQNDM